MQQKILLLLALFTCICTGHAQKQMQVLQPKGEFDIKLASDMLNTGKSEINGVAYYEDRTPIGIKVKPTVYARLGIVVTLYPVTPYLEEYLSLKKKNKEFKRVAAINALASCYRIESKVYGRKGEFAFKGLLPGKYYLETIVHFESGIGGREVSGIVEITKDGEIVEYKLKKII